MMSRRFEFRIRRSSISFLAGALGLAISIIGYSLEASGIALRSVLAAVTGAIATTVVGAILAASLTIRARHQWTTQSQIRSKRAVANLREDHMEVAANFALQATLNELFEAAVDDVVEQAAVGMDEIAILLQIGDASLARPGTLAHILFEWRSGEWPSSISATRLAEEMLPATRNGLPSVADIQLEDGARSLLFVPLVADAKEPPIGTFVALGLLEHATDERAEAAVSALLIWARLATITLGSELPGHRGERKKGEVGREAGS